MNDYDLDTSDLIDIEPGGGGHFVQVSNTEINCIRVILWLIIGVVCIGFLVEYWQEVVAISVLKESNVISPECYKLPDPNWFFRVLTIYSGMEDAQARECHEQKRIASLLPFPNPFIVLVNLFWRGIMGDNSGSSLSRFLSQQSYIVQLFLIVVPICVIGIIVYNLALVIPGAIVRLLHTRDYQQADHYATVQQQLKQPTSLVTTKARLNWRRQLRLKQLQ